VVRALQSTSVLTRKESAMKIYDALMKDHEHVKELLNDLIALDDDDTEARAELVGEIRDELIPHARAEESILYNSMRALQEDNSEVMHGYKEHMEAETLLRALQVTDQVNLGWRKTAEKLKEALEHHIEDEETEIFAEAKELFSDEEAEMMGRAFEQMKPQIQEEGILKTTYEMASNLLPPRLKSTVRDYISRAGL
jgi:hemerythrin superfamily protein